MPSPLQGLNTVKILKRHCKFETRYEPPVEQAFVLYKKLGGAGPRVPSLRPWNLASPHLMVRFSMTPGKRCSSSRCSPGRRTRRAPASAGPASRPAARWRSRACMTAVRCAARPRRWTRCLCQVGIEAKWELAPDPTLYLQIPPACPTIAWRDELSLFVHLQFSPKSLSGCRSGNQST